MSGEQVVKRLLGRRRDPEIPEESHLEAERARALVEESRELVIVLDEEDRVVAASRRARESVEGLQEGARAPGTVLAAPAVVVPYEVDGRRERLVYLRSRGDMAAYEELRAGFTAAVSHELRTPLARVLALLETALLPGADTGAIIEQAQAEVGQIGELINDVLFLSELESGRELVGLGSTPPLSLLREVAEELAESAARAGVTLRVEGDEDAELPLRPRMIRVIAENLLENAIRYAGPGAMARLTVERAGSDVVLTASDNGVGVTEDDLPRLFERFYRSDRARASRGTGLGLAIVKHVVTSAGGSVDASGTRGEGLTIRCVFSAPSPPPR
jgi:two-component system, OmpR family, phosphate regulon sensor histidine kinase PhoR